MCLVDDGTGTGTKVAKYYIDADGNYYELYTYVLYSPNGGVIETSSFTLKSDARRAGQPGRHAGHARDAEQRQSAGPRRADQQGFEPDLRRFRAFESRPTARLHSDSSGRRRGPSGSHHRPAGLQRLHPQCRRHEPAARADLADLLRKRDVRHRRPDHDRPVNIRRQASRCPFYGSLSHGFDSRVSVLVLPVGRRDVVHSAPHRSAGSDDRPFGGNGLGALIGTRSAARSRARARSLRRSRAIRRLERQ